MGERLNNWTSKQKLSAAHLNEAWNLLRKLADVVGYDLNTVGKDSPADNIPRVKLGEVVDAGPNDEADWDDARYWVIDIAIDAADTQDDPIVRSDMTPVTYTRPGDGADVTVPVVHTVTNLPELLDDSHTLTVGTPVLYFELFDRADPTPNVRRVMAIADLHRLIPVKLTQNGGSNGNKTTAASYTYDVFEMSATSAGTVTAGVQIGTAQAPIWGRPNGTATVATLGEAFPASDGGVVLWKTNERYGTGGC